MGARTSITAKTPQAQAQAPTKTTEPPPSPPPRRKSGKDVILQNHALVYAELKEPEFAAFNKWYEDVMAKKHPQECESTEVMLPKPLRGRIAGFLEAKGFNPREHCFNTFKVSTYDFRDGTTRVSVDLFPMTAEAHREFVQVQYTSFLEWYDGLKVTPIPPTDKVSFDLKSRDSTLKERVEEFLQKEGWEKDKVPGYIFDSSRREVHLVFRA